MPNEILPNNPGSWGSWTQMGWRVGPPVPIPVGVASASRLNLNQYGFGIPQSCLHAHCVPLLTDAVGTGTVCPELDTVEASSWVPLALPGQGTDSYVQSYYGVPSATVPYGSSSTDTPSQKQGTSYLGVQFLYPTCLTYNSNTTTIPAASTLDITVFGYDYYYQPLQEYKLLTNAAPTSVGSKAFFGVTGVWVGAGTGDVVFPATISIGTAAQWGFPYAVNDLSQALSVKATLGTPTATAGAGPYGGDVLDGPDVRGTFGFGAELPEGGTVISVTGLQYVTSASPASAQLKAFAEGANPGGLTFIDFDGAGAYQAADIYGQTPLYYGYPVTPGV